MAQLVITASSARLKCERLQGDKAFFNEFEVKRVKDNKPRKVRCAMVYSVVWSVLAKYRMRY